MGKDQQSTQGAEEFRIPRRGFIGGGLVAAGAYLLSESRVGELLAQDTVLYEMPQATLSQEVIDQLASSEIATVMAPDANPFTAVLMTLTSEQFQIIKAQRFLQPNSLQSLETLMKAGLEDGTAITQCVVFCDDKGKAKITMPSVWVNPGAELDLDGSSLSAGSFVTFGKRNEPHVLTPGEDSTVKLMIVNDALLASHGDQEVSHEGKTFSLRDLPKGAVIPLEVDKDGKPLNIFLNNAVVPFTTSDAVPLESLATPTATSPSEVATSAPSTDTPATETDQTAERVATPENDNKYPLGREYSSEGGMYPIFLTVDSVSNERFELAPGFDCYFSAQCSYLDVQGERQVVTVPFAVYDKSGDNEKKLYFYGETTRGLIIDASGAGQGQFDNFYASRVGQKAMYLTANNLGSDPRFLDNPEIAFMVPLVTSVCSDAQFDAFAQEGKASALPNVQGKQILFVID